MPPHGRGFDTKEAVAGIVAEIALRGSKRNGLMMKFLYPSEGKKHTSQRPLFEVWSDRSNDRAIQARNSPALNSESARS